MRPNLTVDQIFICSFSCDIHTYYPGRRERDITVIWLCCSDCRITDYIVGVISICSYQCGIVWTSRINTVLVYSDIIIYKHVTLELGRSDNCHRIPNSSTKSRIWQL